MGRSPRLSLLALLLLSVAGCEESPPPWTCEATVDGIHSCDTIHGVEEGETILFFQGICARKGSSLSDRPCPSANRVGRCTLRPRDAYARIYTDIDFYGGPFATTASARAGCVNQPGMVATFTPD
jgi:hypothetical protein